MRVFITACIAAAAIAAVSAVALNLLQNRAESAFATSSVRI